MVLDTSVKGQTYVEDCEVCCQSCDVSDGAIGTLPPPSKQPTLQAGDVMPQAPAPAWSGNDVYFASV